MSIRVLLKSPWRWFLIAFFVLALFPVLEIVRVTAGPNWHEVEPGQIYRSAQLSGPELKSAIPRFGIKSIINLRNTCPDELWYRDEKSVAQEMGVVHHDLNFSAYLSPAPVELQKLLHMLETTPRPILVHCRRGADRTGLASVMAYLYDHDSDTETAKKQFSLRYGHFGWGKVGVLHEVVQDYFDWLNEQQQPHTRERLKQWANEVYRPGPLWAKIEPVDLPEKLLFGQPGAIRFRFYNQSHKPWHFNQGSNVGMHIRGIFEPEGAKRPPGSDPFTPPLERQRIAAGFLNQTVLPGSFIELDVPYPAIHKPGRYRLVVDIYDEARESTGLMVGSPNFDCVLPTQDDKGATKVGQAPACQSKDVRQEPALNGPRLAEPLP